MRNADAALEALATKYVGDGKSNLIFVTDDMGIVAVFADRSFLKDAKAIANQMVDPCWVEDKTGVAYDNAAAARRQQASDD